MDKKSILKSTMLNKPLSQNSVIAPSGGNNKKELGFGLSLTSMIDAFSILVIFLLVNLATSDIQEKLTHQVKLPEATQSTSVDNGIVISVVKGRFYQGEERLTLNQVFKKLHEAALEKKSLIIEADEEAAFEKLSPIISAASQAGIEKFSFAVVPGGGRS